MIPKIAILLMNLAGVEMTNQEIYKVSGCVETAPSSEN
jgi:hypothetical protein